MTCLMLPRAGLSWQLDAVASELFASVRAPAPCTRINVASAAAMAAARITRLVNFPSLCSLPLTTASTPPRAVWATRRCRRGYEMATACVALEPARLGRAKESARFGLDEPHVVDHQLEGRLGRAPGLVRSDREEPLELPLVCSQRHEALPDRR